MRLPRLPAALAVASALVAGAVVAPPASAAPLVASLVVAPLNGGVLVAKRPLDVDVAITNTGSSALPAGALTFSLEKAPVASTSTLLDGIEHPGAVLLGFLITGVTERTPAVAAGGTATVRARIPADQIAAIVSEADGARILYARLVTGSGALTVVGEAAVVRMARTAPAVGVATVIPVTAPAGTTGVVDVAAQAALSADGGEWSAALAAARAMPSAIVALDPEVPASIRLAAGAAPPSATRFLAALAGLRNTVVRLPYADGDQALQRAAGLTTALEPTTFAGSTTTRGATASAGPTPAASPSASAEPGTPAGADLTGWTWSDVRVAWPVPGTAGANDLTALGRRGPVLLSGGDVRDSVARTAAGPLAVVGGTRVLVADPTTSPLLASAAGQGPAAGAALAALVGALATDAVTGSAPTVLLAAGRGVPAAGLAPVLQRLGGLSWIRGAGLAALVSQQNPTQISLRPHRPAAGRVAAARALVDAEHAVERFGSAITDPAALIGPQRLALLGLLSAAWNRDPAGWTAAASGVTTDLTNFTKRVSIVQSDAATPIGSDGSLSVVVQNRLSHAVTVDVAASVSNGRLQFTGGRSARIRVPASASNSRRLAFRSINNGPAQVVLTLHAPNGAVIGEQVTRDVTVRAGFDTIVAVALLSALGLLLALGVYRNIVRRRRMVRR